MTKPKKGTAFIMSAPAGTGKTTLIRRLAKEFPHVIQSISYTSRTPRAKERDGVDYHFVSRNTFKQMIQEEKFLEHVDLYGDFYGTSKEWVESKLNEGNHVFLVIDTQGALLLKGHYPAVFIFIRPPSLEELERRLKKRKTETKENLKKRLAWAKKELEASDEYDRQIINDDLDLAYESLKQIVLSEEKK